MSLILQPSDFIGKYKIVKNGYTQSDLQDFIDIYESQYLKKLLGCELYALFIADLVSGVPQTPIYLTIFNPICEDYNCSIIESNGMKEMLKALIYFEYGRDSDNDITMSGNTRSSSDNSTKPTQITAGLYKFYNRGINSYCGIQELIHRNSTDYPTYNGQTLGYASFI